MLASPYPMLAMQTNASGQSVAGGYEQIRLDGGNWKGGVAASLWNYGNYTTTVSAGDCIAVGGQACGVTNDLTNPVLGIAMQTLPQVTDAASNKRSMMPIAKTGVVLTNLGYSTGRIFKQSTGIGKIAITAPGSGGTAGTYNWTATGGGCTTEPAGTLTVSGGAVTSVTATTVGVGCTSAPTIPTTSATGLSEATLTPQYPSAALASATTPGDRVVGVLADEYQQTGSAGTGTFHYTLNLRGLQ